MSPESLVENIFNIKTDVWQFGVLLWEIVHYGKLPLQKMLMKCTKVFLASITENFLTITIRKYLMVNLFFFTISVFGGTISF